jgi:hypothetical protein
MTQDKDTKDANLSVSAKNMQKAAKATLPPLIWDVVQRRTPSGPSAPIRAGFSA